MRKVNLHARPGAGLRRYGGAPQPSMRLVCFAWCGAGASVYRRLAPGLSGHIELYAAQLPGREERFNEPRLRRMAQVVETLVEDIAPLADLPLIFFGHSMGALVAYETARALKARSGQEPAALIVSGRNGPESGIPCRRPWHAADDGAFLDHIRGMDGTPPAVMESEAMMSALIPLLRADFEVLETYVHQPGPALSCPVLACAGHADGRVSTAGMAAWTRYTHGGCTIHWFKGGHFYLNRQPRVLTLCIEQWLASLASLQVSHES